MLSILHNTDTNKKQFLSIKSLQPYSVRLWPLFILVLLIPINMIQILVMINMDAIQQLYNVTDVETSYHQSYMSYIENATAYDSILCGGCFFSKTKDGKTCGHYIHQHVFQSLFNMSNDGDNETGKTETNETEQWRTIQKMQQFKKRKYMAIIQKAAYQISIDFPYICSRCDPEACSERTTNGGTSKSGTIYYPYDVAAPKIQRSWSHYLNSIPAENRYPMYGIEHPEEFLSHDANRNKTYYFEFNPSIVVIPDHERQHSFKHPTTGVVAIPVYLASFRVSTTFWCMDMKYHRKLAVRGGNDLLGLAYLDENFDVLAEGIYNLGAEDIRLITLPSTHVKQQQQIYVTNSWGMAVQRELWLNKPDSKAEYETKQQLFVDIANQTMPTIYLSTPPNCLSVTDAYLDGKNAVYFEDATITSQTMPHLVVDGVNYTTANISTPVIVAENWPPQDDGTHKVSFTEVQKRKWCEKPKSFRKTDGELTSISQNNTASMISPIQPSFYTIEEQWYGERLISHIAPWENDRGSACCIEMVDPRTNETVLVGISHTNIRSDNVGVYEILLPDDIYYPLLFDAHNSYLSRFYAFERRRPYRTVALSGRFCWPLITESTINDDINSNQFANMGGKLQFIEATNQTGIGWCPQIHFVMSLLYKVNTNKSSVIVALGVNDCTPRFIEILTSDISQLLFYGIAH